MATIVYFSLKHFVFGVTNSDFSIVPVPMSVPPVGFKR